MTHVAICDDCGIEFQFMSEDAACEYADEHITRHPQCVVLVRRIHDDTEG